MAHHDQQDAAPGRNRSDRPHRSPSPARADPPPTPECPPDQASACAATPPRSRHPTHARSPTKRAHPTRQTYDSVPLRPPVTVALPVSRKPARQPTHTYERGLSPCPYRLGGDVMDESTSTGHLAAERYHGTRAKAATSSMA